MDISSRIYELPIDLTRARVNERVFVGPRNYLFVPKLEDIMSGLTIRLGSSSAGELTVENSLVIDGISDGVEFDTIFLTNTAVANSAEARIAFTNGLKINRDLTYTEGMARKGGTGGIIEVGTTPTKIPGTPLSDRIELAVTNRDAVDIFTGAFAGLTVDNGFKLGPDTWKSYQLAESVDLYAVVAAGTANLHYEELS